MKIKDIKTGAYFCFNGDIEYPHLKTETGYADLMNEEHFTSGLNAEVTTMERWVVDRVMIPYEMPPQEITDICNRLLSEYAKKIIFIRPQQMTLFEEVAFKA